MHEHPPVPSTPSPARSAETRVKAWRAFAHAVAGLHRRNVLRSDLDLVNRVAYDPATDGVAFPEPADSGQADADADVDALARNLIPLLQLARAGKPDRAPALWEQFEQAYVDGMDGRGPRVIERLLELQADLRRASELDLQALSQAYLGKAVEAESAFVESLRVRQAAGDHDGYCRTLCNLALFYADAGRMPDAMKTVERAVIWGRSHGRFKGRSLALLQKGLLLNRRGDHEAALGAIDRALNTWKETGQPLPSQFAAMAEAVRAGKEVDHRESEEE